MQHERTHSHFMSGGRYPVLRTIGILYLIAAGVTAIAAIVGFGWSLASAPANWGDRWTVGLSILAAGFLGVLMLLVVAEVIKLFIDVEHNSRMCAMALAARADQSVVIAPTPAGTVVAPATEATVPGTGVGSSRIAPFLHTPDEETAEAALIRGH
jgi:hypothetical protein